MFYGFIDPNGLYGIQSEMNWKEGVFDVKNDGSNFVIKREDFGLLGNGDIFILIQDFIDLTDWKESFIKYELEYVLKVLEYDGMSLSKYTDVGKYPYVYKTLRKKYNIAQSTEFESSWSNNMISTFVKLLINNGVPHLEANKEVTSIIQKRIDVVYKTIKKQVIQETNDIVPIMKKFDSWFKLNKKKL